MAGSTLTYTLTLDNAGPSAAASVTLSDTLPAGTTFVSLTAPGGWSCTTPAVGSSGTVSCTQAAMLPGNAVFTLVVAVDPGLAAGSVLSNTATVATTTGDPIAANDSDTETTTVGVSADVGVTNVASTPTAINGDPISYTITVSNAGPSDAASVALNNAIPANTTFTSLVAPGGWSCSTPAVGGTGTVTCSITSLAAGASAVFTLTVTVDAAAPPTMIVDTANVTSTTPDPTPGNQAATASTSTPVSLQSFRID